MGSTTGAAPGLSLPRETFAKLTPGPFLEAHLQRPNPIRPNGRSLNEARPLTFNIGSLSHSNGSAVVRSGDTAVVCGVRAEVLLASSIPQPPNDVFNKDGQLEQLGLLVPNLELSTGCSAAHLPGNPPGTLAQSLSYRILSLLHSSRMLDMDDLRIQYLGPVADDAEEDGGGMHVTKAYWTLHIDILCIALDGNAFDTAWAAVVAALQDTVIPKAWWDPDQEGIRCSPDLADAHKLTFRCLPMAITAHMFTTSQGKQGRDAQSWMLADADTFEEDISAGSLTVVTSDGMEHGGLLKIERSGRVNCERSLLSEYIEIVTQRRKALQAAVGAG